MFTGLVEHIGTIDRIDHRGDDARLWVTIGPLADGTAHGDSIAVNGVCLTVAADDDTAPIGETVAFDVMGETLRRSNLGELQAGDRVNLERAMAADTRFGGHLVQGHVDAMATLLQRTPHERWEVVRFSLPQELAPFVVEKGSMTVSGTSLTVSAVSDPQATEPWFEVSLIPVTLRDTILGALTPGATVNLEVDIVAKYVSRLRAFDAADASTKGTDS